MKQLFRGLRLCEIKGPRRASTELNGHSVRCEQGECGLSLVDGRSLMNSGGHPLGTKSHLWSAMACSAFNQHHVSYQGMPFWAYRTKANNRYVYLTKAQHCQLCLPLFHAKHYPAQQALRQDHAWRNTTTTRRTQVSSFLHLSDVKGIARVRIEKGWS